MHKINRIFREHLSKFTFRFADNIVLSQAKEKEIGVLHMIESKRMDIYSFFVFFTCFT
jgi:hypothetical protein